MSKEKYCPMMSNQSDVRGRNICMGENCQWWSYAIDNCIVHMMENLTSVIGNIVLKD